MDPKLLLIGGFLFCMMMVAKNLGRWVAWKQARPEMVKLLKNLEDTYKTSPVKMPEVEAKLAKWKKEWKIK